MSWLLVLSGCVARPDAPTAWLAPFDGQTAIAADVSPTIDIATEQPEGQPLDLDLIRVVNLTTGEPVTGFVERDDRSIWFAPDLPWAADTDYAWSVQAPAEQPRGPSSVFPPVLVGTSSFSTRGALDLVAVGSTEDAVCALWSRPADLSEISLWSAEIDGEAAGDWTLLAVDDPAAERGLVGPSVSCVTGAGQTLRLTAPSADGADVVLSMEIDPTDPETVVQELRRWSP